MYMGWRRRHLVGYTEHSPMAWIRLSDLCNMLCHGLAVLCLPRLNTQIVHQIWVVGLDVVRMEGVDDAFRWFVFSLCSHSSNLLSMFLLRHFLGLAFISSFFGGHGAP